MSGGGRGIAAGVVAAGRPAPPTQPSPPPAPLIAPTGSPGLNSVIDVVNATAAPFMNAPPPEQGAAGVVAAGLGGVMGVIGAPQQIIDTAFATLTAPIAAMCPSLPAVTLLGMHVGVPHAHSHPPSLIPPAPPVPLPSIGMLLGAGAVTVLIGGMPAARAGDIGISVTCGSLAPPFEVFTGSSNVFIGGARAARTLDITKHCNPTAMGPFAIAMGAAGVAAGAAGAIAGNNIFAAAQAAADAAVLAFKILCGKDPGIPPGMGTLVGPPVPNVLIGGFPCPPIGDMAVGAILKGLSKAAKAVKNKFSKKGNASCANGTHPVYLVTGENFDKFVDFVSGDLFEWRRHYTTARARSDGPLGHGWRHFYQRNLSVRLHRASFTDWDGTELEFPRFPRGQTKTRAEGHVLERVARGHYRISHRDDPVLEFVGNEFAAEVPLVRMFTKERELQFGYDTLGRLAVVVDSSRNGGGQRRYELRYDDSGHLAQLVETTNAAQPVLRAAYAYGKSADLLQAVDAMGGAWFYECDAFHRWTKQTDARGYSYTFKYDALGRCTDATGQDGLWWAKIEYFPEKGYTRYTEGENATWHFYYDSDGIVTKIVDPYGGEKLRERDGEGRVIREIDAGGRVLEWLYDADGAHVARRDRFGYLYPPELEQPVLANPLARDLPSTPLARLFAGAVEPSPTAALGASGSLLSAVPSELNDLSRRVFRTNTQGATRPPPKRVEKDALARPLREIDARGRTREWRYDATGNLIAERDRDGRVTERTTTSWNLLGERRDPLGHGLRYKYSKLEQIVAIEDALGNVSRYDYDLKMQLVRVHRNDRVREEYVFDGGNHLIGKKDSQGQTLFENVIHENHLVALRTLASGGFHRYDYDARGRTTEASTENFQVLLAYDDAGRRLYDVRDGKGVQHRHVDGQRRSLLFDRYPIVEDSRAASTAVVGPRGEETLLRFDDCGLVLRTSPNGTSELSQYDEEGRLEARLTFKRGKIGRWETWAVCYVYSPEGDLIRIDDSARGTTSFELDAAHRLVAEIGPGGQRQAFNLDAAGNIRSKPGLGNVRVGKGNRLEASQYETFEYDSRDHLSERRTLDGTVTRYTYDSFDMLVRVQRTRADGKCELDCRYEHDAMGRRATSRTASAKREFFWDGDRLTAEVLPSGRLRIYYYAGRDALVPIGFTEYASKDAPPEAGESFFVYSDPVGMPLHIEDADGKVVWWANRIDPYGLIEVRSDSKLEYNLRWPGHYYDPETGLHCNRYRVYDPLLGRYLQSDPLGYEGSELNLYAYPANPLIHVDILGLHPDKPGSGREGDGPDGTEGTDLPTATRAAADRVRGEGKATRPVIMTGMKTPDGTITTGGSHRGPSGGGLEGAPQTKAAFDRAAAEVRPPPGAGPDFPGHTQSGNCGEPMRMAEHERATGQLPPPGTEFHSSTVRPEGNPAHGQDKPACPYCSHVMDEQGYTSSSGTSEYAKPDGTVVPAKPATAAPPPARGPPAGGAPPAGGGAPPAGGGAPPAGGGAAPPAGGGAPPAGGGAPPAGGGAPPAGGGAPPAGGGAPPAGGGAPPAGGGAPPAGGGAPPAGGGAPPGGGGA